MSSRPMPSTTNGARNWITVRLLWPPREKNVYEMGKLARIWSTPKIAMTGDRVASSSVATATPTEMRT